MRVVVKKPYTVEFTFEDGMDESFLLSQGQVIEAVDIGTGWSYKHTGDQFEEIIPYEFIETIEESIEGGDLTPQQKKNVLVQDLQYSRADEAQEEYYRRLKENQPVQAGFNWKMIFWTLGGLALLGMLGESDKAKKRK